MADGFGGSRPHFTVKFRYTISERERLILNFRALAGEIAKANGGHVSAQALSDIIDDVFIAFEGWREVEDLLFQTLYKARLDANTLRNFLVCELGLALRKKHDGSFRVLDAFQQIVAVHRPSYF